MICFSRWLRPLLVLLGVSFFLPAPALAQTSATVIVSASTVTATIPAGAFGVNTAVWDGNLLSAAVPGLLSAAGVSALRFPGGSTSDVYHWQTHSSTAGTGQYVNPANTFDAFMGLAQTTGAAPIIVVNYGSNAAGTAGGDPNEAAAWVDYANNTKHYNVKYWEIGNEIYGNGLYGAAWETDLHADHSPAAYGQNCVAFITAMKAKDPTIKVGVVLTAPNNWPDGQTPNWNAGVLGACGTKIDFVVIHWYPQGPGSESDSYLLSSPQQIAGMVSAVRMLVTQSCGANTPNVRIFVTETNSVSYNPGKQSVSLVNALFLADNYSAWLENGVANVDWWDLHNYADAYQNNNSSLYGTANYGDYGLLSSGNAPAPAADTPVPPYYGLKMLSYFSKAGDQTVNVSSSQSLLSVHGVKQANGKLALLLINKSPASACAADVTVNGYSPASASTVYFYGIGSTAITQTAGTASSHFTQTVPPYSLTTVVMQPLTTTISGTVTLQGWVGLPQPVTLTLTPTGTTTGSVITQTVTPSVAGAFSLAAVPPGTYTLGMKGSLWLRKTVSVNTMSGSVSALSMTLPGGDVNNDNSVSATDLALTRQAYGTMPAMPNWNANADFNGDGQIAGADLAIVRANYGQVGN